MMKAGYNVFVCMLCVRLAHLSPKAKFIKLSFVMNDGAELFFLFVFIHIFCRLKSNPLWFSLLKQLATRSLWLLIY